MTTDQARTLRPGDVVRHGGGQDYIVAAPGLNAGLAIWAGDAAKSGLVCVRDHPGYAYLPVPEVERVAPAPCTCDLWQGCTCGAMERERQARAS